MLQTYSWHLTSVSRSLGSDPSCLWRSRTLVRSWIRRGWSPTCPSSTSSFVDHLYLYQVTSLTLPSPVFSTLFSSFWTQLESYLTQSSLLSYTLYYSTWSDSTWLSSGSICLHSILQYSTLLSSALLNSTVKLKMTWWNLTLTL